MPLTKLSNLVNPQVLADMISAEMPYAIRFAPIAPLDYTLVGQPGDTITIPKFAYIGDASVVLEGGAVDYTKLVATTKPHTILKIAKGTEITDEAVLSGYGDPVGEGKSQIVKSLAQKIDADILAAIDKTVIVATADKFDESMIEAIENVFNDEDETTGVIFMNSKDAIKLRRGAMNSWERASDLGDSVLVSGAFGALLGWTIVRSNRLAEGQVRAVKAGALKTYLKRDVFAEVGRDMDHKQTKFNADQHYVVALYDESKAMKVTVTVV